MPRWTISNTTLEETKDGPRLLSTATGAVLGRWAGIRPVGLPRALRHAMVVAEVNARRHAPTLAARYPDAGAVDAPTVGLVTDDLLDAFRGGGAVLLDICDEGFYCLMGGGI